MRLITMHNSTKFYLNVIITSEVIYCSMRKNVILEKTDIFSAFFWFHKLKMRYLNCATMREFGLFRISK